MNTYIQKAMIELEKGDYGNYKFYMSMNRRNRVRKESFANDNFGEEQCDSFAQEVQYNRLNTDKFSCRSNADTKINYWSEYEREYLELNYLIKSDKEIAEKLNRPINGVKWQRRMLGLSKPLNWKK